MAVPVIITVFAFAALYPIYFWIPIPEPFKTRFRKISLVLPNIFGGIVLIAVWIIDIPIFLKVIVSFWKIILLSVSKYSWKKPYPNPLIMTIPVVFGAYAVYTLKKYCVSSNWDEMVKGVCLITVICSVFFYIHRKSPK